MTSSPARYLTRLAARVTATVVAALLVLVGFTAQASAAEDWWTTTARQWEAEILQLLNRDRVAQNLHPLQRVVELDDIARTWSATMARENRIYHNPYFREQTPSPWSMTGENVAMGHQSAREMYQAWYDSPGHRFNMMNVGHTHIGIGVVLPPEFPLWPSGTQNFAEYDPETAPPLTPTPPVDVTPIPRPGATPPAPNPTPPAPAPSNGIPGEDGSSTNRISDGGIGGQGSEFHLANSFSTAADIVFRYGNTGGRFYVGDWDGDGRDTLAYRIGATFYVRDTNTAGAPDRVFTYGRPGDRVYVGDWNGDGRDTFAVRRGATYHVKNSLTGGPADTVIVYGRSGDDVVVGDWDGDGRDTFAVRRGRTYFVKNTIAGGNADTVVAYGRDRDAVLVGDWDGDGRDTFAVRRGRTYFIANAIRAGAADKTIVYGREYDATLVGDWNGDGTDTIGIRRS